MLPPSELKLIRSFEHGGTITCPFSTVSSAFYHHATANPRALALRDLSCSPPRDLSYRELAHRAQCLAQRLRDLGVGPGQRVPLVVKRGVDMVVGIWAILSAGAQYVPLDGGVVPDSTVRLVVEQSGGCAVALCVASTEHRLVGVREGLRAVRIEDNSRGPSEGASTGVFMDLAKPESGCYVIYTSGTTGKPKGVDVTHRNVANLVCQAPGSLDIGPGDKVGSLLNISFDMAAWEIFACLCNGGALVMRGSQWEPALEQINILICTPTILSKYQPSRFPQIKVVATAGEPSTQHLADLWATHATYWNCCGPTETTIVNTMSRHIVGQPLSIGKPTPNNAVYILSTDDDLTRVPVGAPGCMWAGGHGVSRGYVGLEGRTREAYVPDELAGDGSSMYKTGDLGSWRADGSIDILGRADDQVKVKGFRVELDGVAASISSFPGVTRATALLVDGRIVAFASPAHHDAASVIEFAKRSQPYYAVPSSVVLLPSLPATPNGKIDKQALRAMAARPIDLFPDVPSASEQGSSNGSSRSGSSSGGSSSSGSSNSSNTSDSESDSEHADEKKNDSAAAVVAVDPESLAQTHSLSPATTGTGTTGTSLREKRAGEDSSSEDEEKADALSSDIPGKNQDQPLRGLRHIVFITYRRLFSLIWLVNIGALVALLLMADGSRWLGLLVAANLTACVLIRQELVINALYTVTCSVPKSFPLWIRARCAKIYHLGGVHSGAGICATAWLLISTVRSTIEMWSSSSSSSSSSQGSGTNNPKALAVLVLSWLLCLLTCSLVGFAWPGFRKRFHNHFERIHRFVGWTTLAVFWARTVLAIDAERGAATELGLAVARSPIFWLLLVATLSVASSWFFLRRVPVEAEVLSDHAVRLHFDYTVPVNGSFTRVSRRPLLEWHSFATIPQPAKPEGNGKGGYSLVVSNAGDWTRSCIRNPPRELWVRGLPTCGVMRVATLFRRVVVIATGSGIGPLLGHIDAPSCPTQLIWSTPNPEATFGRAIIDSVRRSIPDAVIHDTRAQGRPDLVKMGFNMARGSGAEAVIIIANEKITKKVVYGLQTRGVPAYGAIWDS